MKLRPSLIALALSLLPVLPAGAAEIYPATDETLAMAFAAINERALVHQDLGPLAFDGLTAISSIDPSLKIEAISSRRVGLLHAGRLVAQYPRPPSDDVEGWASLCMQIERQIREISPAARSAGAEQFRMAVLDAALSHLDRFSRYAPPGEADEQRANRSGFGGIGVRLEPHDQDVTLTEVLPGTPADKAHLRAGDHILAIDGKPLAGLTQDMVSHLMRGPVDSKVSLTVKPLDQQQASVITLTRDHIMPPSVRTSALEDGVATIAISSFNESTDEELFQALSSFSGNSKLKGLVIDLRGNPGGLLDKAVSAADLFMTDGIIVTTRGRHPDSQQSYEARPGDLAERVKLVVLMDGRTASAAEILTAALQDSGRAVVVGTNSYGKGTVQTVLTLPNQGELTLTWSRYYAPSGYSLHELGVLPTLCSEGARTPAEAEILLRGLMAQGNPLPAQLAAWRATPVEDTERRKRLRLSCPAENRLSDADENRLDLDLAKKILKDDGLFAQALSLNAVGDSTNIDGQAASSP